MQEDMLCLVYNLIINVVIKKGAFLTSKMILQKDCRCDANFIHKKIESRSKWIRCRVQMEALEVLVEMVAHWTLTLETYSWLFVISEYEGFFIYLFFIG